MVKNKNKNNQKSKRFNEGSLNKKINHIICLLIIIAGGYYIFSVNDLSIQGFRIYELKSKLSEYIEINKDFEARAMQLNSYPHIVKKAEEMNLVKVDTIDYLSQDGAVAINE